MSSLSGLVWINSISNQSAEGSLFASTIRDCLVNLALEEVKPWVVDPDPTSYFPQRMQLLEASLLRFLELPCDGDRFGMAVEFAIFRAFERHAIQGINPVSEKAHAFGIFTRYERHRSTRPGDVRPLSGHTRSRVVDMHQHVFCIVTREGFRK
jgi:hypothetical protein